MRVSFKKSIIDAHGDTITFWFVRHAESEGNILGDDCPVMHNEPLSKAGVSEAEQIAEYFKKHQIPVDGLYCAPKGRTHETAEIIGLDCGLVIRVREGLGGRNWGEWGVCSLGARCLENWTR